MASDFDVYLKSDEVVDYHHPSVKEFIQSHRGGGTSLEQMVNLYYAVRDGVWYDPFDIRFSVDALKTWKVLEKRRGHCIDKAVLTIACSRAVGVPARLGLARVKNHMGTARLERVLQTDVLSPHGYVEIHNGMRWVKCTPAFNKALCEKLNVAPLEFDGNDDSIFQAYDRGEGGFMTYLSDFGSFETLPVAFLRSCMESEYPHLFDADGRFKAELLRA
jgi:transglutaminase-like putative cysteine protease